MLRILLACFTSMLLPVTGWTGGSDLFRQLGQTANASLLMEDPNGHILHEQQINQPLIPASTLKLLTAYAALKTWGPQYRFHTDFFLDNNNRLIVKGYGDPLLISEELDVITDMLVHKGLKQINGIKTDSSFFSNSLNIDGQSTTNNPYDASPGALASNFNTVFIQKSAQGIFSAETQTPLTTLSTRLAQSVSNGKHRINLGKQEDGASYFAQLLQAKLKAKKVLVNGRISKTTQTDDLPIFYRHYNSKTLAENIQGMLEYSNNFIANQVFLLLGTATYGPPASMHKSRQALNAFINREFNWAHHQIVEGAGLSRKNSMTAQQLVDVLNKLKPYAYLLPEQNSKILAKTGTLQNVSSYAGYIKNSRGLNPFALIINHPVNPEFRLRLAETLANIHAK